MGINFEPKCCNIDITYNITSTSQWWITFNKTAISQVPFFDAAIYWSSLGVNIRWNCWLKRCASNGRFAQFNRLVTFNRNCARKRLRNLCCCQKSTPSFLSQLVCPFLGSCRLWCRNRRFSIKLLLYLLDGV